MIRNCVWVGICATLLGCGPNNEAAGNADSGDSARGGLPPHEGSLESLVETQYSAISERYSASATAFERLAVAMDQERDVVQVYCDEDLKYVQTRTSIHYEGEDSDILSTFLELCLFEEKVVASNGDSQGIRFPHDLHEVGPIRVSTVLVRRLDDSMDVESCSAVNLDQPWGHCQQPISVDWRAHFKWLPICFYDAGSNESC